MKMSIIQQTLARSDIAGNLTFARTSTSAVTTAWGVDWDETYIARDLMQNFFDANRSALDKIIIRKIGNDVVISAPAEFNLERLFYLGSEKGANDVGHYGEGFKVAATCLLRDHAVTPIAMSGHDVAVLRVAHRTVAGTHLSPIEYDFYNNDCPVSGTVLLLPGCSVKLVKALEQGLTHFFHSVNPLLGAKRWSDFGDGFLIYDSTDQLGHVFYRNLKRGEIEGIPVVLVIKKEYQAIERKIMKDRDRNAFGDEVMKLFYEHFARYGLKYGIDGQKAIVMAAQPCWERGHSLLSEMAKSIRNRWPSKTVNEVFGEKYYARSAHSSNPMEQLEINRLERIWRDDGKVALPGYFRSFGVLHAGDEIRRAQETATEESKKNNQRRPTGAEQNAIRLLSKVLQELAPEIIAIFNKGRTSYTVALTEVVLGQLKSGRSYNDRDVFLAESVFISDFAGALAIFLHEHAHIFGYDGRREFTDALTRLLETAVRHRHDLDRYEVEWGIVKAAVQNERFRPEADGETSELDLWLSAMSAIELRELIGRLPRVALRKLRDNRAQ